VAEAPGLYFVGLHFLYSLSSEMIRGVGRDADRIAGLVAVRASAAARGGRDVIEPPSEVPAARSA